MGKNLPAGYSLVESNLPNWDTEVSSSFTVSGARANVVLDVPVPPQHLVSGRVTRNGLNPVVTGSCTTSSPYWRAIIRFTHLTDTRFSRTVFVRGCTQPTDAFDFSTELSPGTYSVSVGTLFAGTINYVISTNLPSWDAVVVSAITIP